MTTHMIVKLTYFGAEFKKECAAFRSASTGLDHANSAPESVNFTIIFHS